MVLEQKPLLIQNDKCLEIQTNSEDVEDNKLCLETLKARKVLNFLQQVTITVVPAGAGQSMGIMLANGTAPGGGGNVKAGVFLSEGYQNGFMQYVVDVGDSGPVLPCEAAVVIPTATSLSVDMIHITPIFAAQNSDGNFPISSYKVTFYYAGAPTQNLDITADLYVAQTA